jgi:hypothetical protein
MIKDHLKAYGNLTTACLLWTASTVVKPIYISSEYVLRAIGKANDKAQAKATASMVEPTPVVTTTHATSFSEVLEHYSK